MLSLLLSGAGQIYAFLGVFVLIGLALVVLSRLSLDDDAADDRDDDRDEAATAAAQSSRTG